MSDYIIIDRRKNPTGKNLPNRQRFLRHIKKWLTKKVQEGKHGNITDSPQGRDISVPGGDINEPNFGYNQDSGIWDRIFPGNKEFQKGDKIDKPAGGSGGAGNNAGQDGADDEFVFSIDRDEYLDILFEDLELPDLVKKSEKSAVTWKIQRAGFRTWGPPPTIDLVRSLKNSLGRRLALKKPVEKQIEELEKELEKDENVNEEVLQLLEVLKRRSNAISWIDPVDIKYKRWEKIPVPNTQAVMFCLMDVSASMEEYEKELSKRFFLLLYLFLQRKYKKVDIIFIRHTTTAKECDEQEFFYSSESGGTEISSGLKLIQSIIHDRYPLDAWNIYAVQATDGDNIGSDNQVVEQILNQMLPIMQYYIYIQVANHDQNRHDMMMQFGFTVNSTWDTMKKISESFSNLKLVALEEVDKVVTTFRSLFTKD